ncbi:hypothetical protein [Corynebacterium kozikiae]|uniref:hypothetical protein n=1 Tax=Corynebacterium kozikiae TaxID=2968469 RepID=UPI00211B8753|nr:hypothetical protein [Corynebacterium sp. 76QC2CO]MCQ9344281.1 hypothetical protein [Corynebacterium sp. 76QC2CO]
MKQALGYLSAVAIGLLLAQVLPMVGASALHGVVVPALFLLMVLTFAALPADAHPRPGFSRFLGALTAANFLGVPMLLAVLLVVGQGIVDLPTAVLLPALLVLLAPCIDYVVPFSKLAGAAYHQLLRATPLLLLGQVVAVPLWLSVFGLLVGAEWESQLNPVGLWPILHAALVFLVLPLCVVWVVRRVNPQWLVAAQKAMDPAMWLVLGSIAAGYGGAIAQSDDLLPLAVFYVVFAVAAYLLGGAVGAWSGLALAERRAVAMCAMTRNSLVVLPIAMSVAPGPMTPAVVVCQTVWELLVICMLQMMRKSAV